MAICEFDELGCDSEGRCVLGFVYGLGLRLDIVCRVGVLLGMGMLVVRMCI